MAPAVEIAAVTELKDSFFSASNSTITQLQDESFNGFETGQIVLEFYGFGMDNYLERDFVWLVLLILFYRATAYGDSCWALENLLQRR